MLYLNKIRFYLKNFDFSGCLCYDYAIKETNALYAAAIKNGYSVTEEDYWNYEFSVYEKNLPIQNYVADLECSYAQEEHLVQGSEEFQ